MESSSCSRVRVSSRALGLGFIVLLAISASAAEEEAPPVNPEPSLSPSARAGVVHAMRAAGLEPRDAGFEKKAAPRPFCLELVEEGLDRPFRVPDQADLLTGSLKRPAAADALRHAGGPLPDEGGWRKGDLAGGPASFPGTPPSLGELFDAWRAAASTLPEVSSEDFEFLLARGEMAAFREDAGGTPSTAEEVDRLLDTGRRLGPGRVPPEVHRLLRACERVVADADAWRALGPAVFERPVGAPGPVPRIVVTGTDGDFLDASADEADIVVDLGGNDTWSGAWASGVGRVQVVIDLGGNDRYEAPELDYVQGAGVLGVGILVDAGGNDVYRARHGSQGAGFLGVGALVDLGGDDVYEGDTFLQGAGLFGVGMLRDGGGRDSYRAALFAQGFGRTRGVGVLQDRGGNDSYFAGGKYADSPDRWGEGNTLSLSQGFAYGFRPMEGADGAAGGIGILLDEGAGADMYTCDIFGQGCSYWYSLGVLVDEGGNDSYTAQQYAQGSGIHLSVGILVDRAGMDRYQCVACCQGQGHDLAVGWLLDLAGDDTYSAKDLCQGAGSANGIGFHVDAAGDDGYLSRTVDRGQPYGNPRRGYGSLGFLVDLAGKDTYSGRLRDGEGWVGSTWAAGVDYAEGDGPPDPGEFDDTPVRDEAPPAAEAPPPPPMPADPVAGTPEAAVLALFRRATVRDRAKADDRKAALAELSAHPAALGFLVKRLDLWNRFVRNDGVFPAVAKARGDEGVPVLAAALGREKVPLRRRVLLEMLGATGSPAAVPRLVAAAKDPDGGVRQEACEALGSLPPGPESLDALSLALGDAAFGVRIAALNALGRFGEGAAGRMLAIRDRLDAPDFRERFQAASVLARFGPTGALALSTVVAREEAPASVIAARALASVEELAEGTLKPLVMAAVSARSILRAASVEAIGRHGRPEERVLLTALLQDETDPFVHGAARRAREAIDARNR